MQTPFRIAGKIPLVLVIASMLITACNSKTSVVGYDTRLQIVNNSGIDIYFGISENYPDSLHPNMSYSVSGPDYLVPKGSKKMIDKNGSWDNYISSQPQKTLMLMIYPADTINKIFEEGYSDLVIQRTQDSSLAIKHYNITLDYLYKNDFKIVFP